jgi:hypothetical protein
MRLPRHSLVVCLAVLVTACHGGDSSNDDPPPNNPPANTAIAANTIHAGISTVDRRMRREQRLADFARPWMSWLLRPLPDLTTDPGNIVHTLPTPAGIAIGIIAGSRDRTVTLPETALAGASETALVPAGHSFLMNLPAVQELTIRFLRTGRFGISPEAP